MSDNRPITVTSPLLPDLDEFNTYLREIWNKKWLTNNGSYHKELEKALCEYLKVQHLSLFANGTLALLVALKALNISGDVITTPYSFVATSHSLVWNGINPVFVDIEPNTFNIDPHKIEAAITPNTTAILPVHVYGNPCDTSAIQQIADKYNLRVIYDAAHAFGITQNDKTLLDYGDLSILSFHATKVYSTIEGGAIICRSEEMKQQIDYLKNFGFANETTVLMPGINAKLNEVQAAFGLLSLQKVDEAIAKRKHIAEMYRKYLEDIQGIRFLLDMEGLKHNYGYFPILVDEKEYGISRDILYEKLKANNIYGRRYFYPLISEFPVYKNLKSAAAENLPVANRVANSVICLPIHQDLTDKDIEYIVSVIKNKIR